jgi:hypothetical protein
MRSGLVTAVVALNALVAFAADDPATILARILAEKGTLNSTDLAKVESAAAAQKVDVLTSLLADKGVLTSGDLARLGRTASETVVAQQPRPSAPPKVETSSPPVVSQSKSPITVYGTLLFNAFYDTSLTNIQDIPLFAGKQGSDALGNDKSFGMTARQTRIGMRYTGPEVAGARISGQAEVDFLGGKAAFGNGINMDLVRLRLAFGRLDWKSFSLEAGQDWSVFAPLNPTSLAEFAIPGLSASGNPWIRMPQLRAEFHNDLSDTTRVQFQVAAVDPDMGDYNTAVFSSGRTPGIGERGRFPGVDSRLGFTTKAENREFAFGVSSHYTRGKNAGVVGSNTLQTPVDSWGAAIDYSLPVSKALALSGEWFVGRALGIFSVASGEAVLPVGTPGQNGVDSRGGWSQLQFNFNPKWQANLSYGIDAERNRNLRVGDRNKNQTYVGNIIYKFTPNVNFAWEWRRFLTNWKDQRAANEIGDHFNLAVAYIF